MKYTAYLCALTVLGPAGCGSDDGGGAAGGGGGSSRGGTGATSGAAGSSSGNGGSAGGGVAPIPIDGFVSATSSSVCDNIGACCARGGYPFDAAECRSVMESYAAALAAGATDDPPTSTYDAAMAGACVTLTAERARECVVQPLPEPNPCDLVFRGLLAQGEPCRAASECAPVEGSYLTCESSGADPATRCTAHPDQSQHGTAGEACSETCVQRGDGSTVCEGFGEGGATCYWNDGLYCSESGNCAALPSLGSTCSSYCAEGAHCENAACAPQSATGPCVSSDACVSTSYCNPTTSLCEPKAADGTDCAPSGDDSAEQCLSGGCYGACGPPLLASEESCFSN